MMHHVYVGDREREREKKVKFNTERKNKIPSSANTYYIQMGQKKIGRESWETYK